MAEGRSNKAAVQATNDDPSASKLKSAKGTVTSLSSIFSPEDAHRAASCVEEAIAERRNELDCVQSFVEDNSSLVKLVQRLPDRLHHDIMVPFGKGAFFPGKLIHTNEFLVLLGDGYYADRTSKQTVEILNRRGKELESQVESLKAMIKDLKAEASFFNDTATEAAEGLVEIMEDYVDEIRDDKAFSKAPMKMQVDSGLFENENINISETDEEFARMMAKMDELEEAEIAAESENGDGERLVSGNKLGKAESGEVSNSISSDPDDEMNMKGRDFHTIESRKSKVNLAQPRNPLPHDLTSSEKFQCKKTAYELFLNGDQKPHDKFENSKMQPEASATKTAPRGEILLRKDLTRDSGSNTQKAFTGSIIERAYNLEPKNQTGTSSQSATSLPSKPVSRFKMMQRK